MQRSAVNLSLFSAPSASPRFVFFLLLLGTAPRALAQNGDRAGEERFQRGDAEDAEEEKEKEMEEEEDGGVAPFAGSGGEE